MSITIEKKAPATGVEAVRAFAWDTVNNTRGNCIALGKRLKQLKSDTLADGKAKSEWYAVFGEDSKRKQLKGVEKYDGFPFGSDAAGKLIAVAETFGKVDNSVIERLPASWGTLYELTLVHSPDFKAACKSGDIWPGMTRDEAKALKPLKPVKKVSEEDVKARQQKTARASLAKLPTEAKLQVAVEVLRDAGCSLNDIISAWNETETQSLLKAA